MRDWTIKIDMNSDGVFTITDVWLLVKSLYFYPGDFFVKNIIGTQFGVFFEFSSNDYSGFLSGVVSFLAWVVLLCMPFGMVMKNENT